jgi:predicted porin
VGAYYAQSEGLNVQVEGLRFRVPRETLRENVGTNAFADLAWQVVAGADYYWTPKFSTFIEYHFLDYTSDTLLVVREPEQRQQIQELKREFDLDLKQHLVGIGVRLHF